MYKSEERIKTDMLNRVKNTIDKSENSLVFDTLSPASMEIAHLYTVLEAVAAKMDIENLQGEELERHIYQRSGLERKPATKARTTVIIAGEPGTSISRGDLVGTETRFFTVLESQVVGAEGIAEVEVESEVAGENGNVPAEAIKRFPVAIPGLTSVINPEPASGGYEAETDHELLERYYEKIKTPAISGNRHHYLIWAKEVPGVGDARVVPTWAGPGTVKVVVVDSNKMPASQELVDEVANHIEEERPLGADVTVEPAKPKQLDVHLTVVKDDAYTLEQVRLNIQHNIEKHLEEIAFDRDFISFAHIGRIILESEGVQDYSDLTLNGGIDNVLLGFEEVPVLSEVVISE
ncbi:MAG: baseplate J/gp47 family protein [Bacillota bacterium]|nr:baseplate J/gp47 family protein [Bacillota bacterium]